MKMYTVWQSRMKSASTTTAPAIAPATAWNSITPAERDGVSASVMLRVRASIRSSGTYERRTRDVVTRTTCVLNRTAQRRLYIYIFIYVHVSDVAK